MEYNVISESTGTIEDGIDSVEVLYLDIEVPEGISSEEELSEFKQDVNDRYAQGCCCSHDCCGHWFGGLDMMVQRWKSDNTNFIARLSFQRNV